MAMRTLSSRVQALAAAGAAQPIPLERAVDLEKYTDGEWFSYSAIPTWFQPVDAINARATYRLNKNKDMMLICNQQHVPTQEGWEAVAWNAAAVPTNQNNSTLRLRMAGQYWILELDEDYLWAVVGSPGRTTLWVLTREPGKWPAKSKHSYEQVLEIIEQVHKYDINLLEPTVHDTSVTGALPPAEFPDTSMGANTAERVSHELRRIVRLV